MLYTAFLFFVTMLIVGMIGTSYYVFRCAIIKYHDKDYNGLPAYAKDEIYSRLMEFEQKVSDWKWVLLGGLTGSLGVTCVYIVLTLKKLI